MPAVPRPSASSSPPRELRRDYVAHREAIVSAALVVLTREGSGTVADVAREAGLTRATVYRHFPDRDALLDGLVETIAGPLAMGFVDEIDDGPLPDAMERLAHAVLAHVADHRAIVRLVAPRLEALARAAVDDEPLTAALARRRAAGELSVPMTDAWLAAGIRALCMAAVADERPPEQVAADLAATLRRLVV